MLYSVWNGGSVSWHNIYMNGRNQLQYSNSPSDHCFTVHVGSHDDHINLYYFLHLLFFKLVMSLVQKSDYTM